MGLRAILPGPHTSKRHKDHPVFPYLLHGLNVNRPNQVWATDISYIPMWNGYMYLTAIIDLFSRYVLSWSLSNTMYSEWCADIVSQAVEKYGNAEIINTDQGGQYTSDVFVERVKSHKMKLSMDGKGRPTDNAFIERLWRSVKYEKLYIFSKQELHPVFFEFEFFFIFLREFVREPADRLMSYFLSNGFSEQPFQIFLNAEIVFVSCQYDAVQTC